MGRWFRVILVQGFVCTFVVPSIVSAQGPSADSVRQATVTVATGPITVDGVLDESAWSSAPKIGDLIQRQPNEGENPTERTEVMLLRDADQLYIGVVAYDSEPSRAIGSVMARDGGLMADDRLEGKAVWGVRSVH